MQMERRSSCLLRYQQPGSAACKRETSRLSYSGGQNKGKLIKPSDDVTASHDPSAQSGFALTIICSGCGSHEPIEV